MRSTLLLCLGLLTAAPLCAQTFNSPESVEYDALRRRWLVSQNGANRIDVYRPGATPALTPLVSTGITSGPHGLATIGDTLYACDGGRIKGYNLATGAQVFNVNLSASFLNGLTSDGGHYLFATDFSGKKIFRVNTATGAFNLMATTTKTPNGIYYDGAHQRLVFVTWGSAAAVQALSLTDSTVSTLRTTSLSNIDGITRDHEGRWYVAAWGNNGLHQLDSGFTQAPVSVRTGLNSPADIAINAAGDSIAIPNSGGAGNVVFYVVPGIPTGVAADVNPLLPMGCYPNPAATHCLVSLEAALPGATLVLRDTAGRTVREQPLTGTQARLERGTLPDGFYFVSLYDARRQLRAVQKVAFFD